MPSQRTQLLALVKITFEQLRKMLRQSLKPVLDGRACPAAFATKRPEELRPEDFLELTAEIFGALDEPAPHPPGVAIWRTQKLRGAEKI